MDPFFSRFIRPLLQLLTVSLVLTSCGGNRSGPADSFGGFNPRGGAAGSSNFSSIETAPGSSLSPQVLKLPGGLRLPPLELANGRMAVVYGGDDANSPGVALLYNDSVLWRFSFARDQFPMSGLAADSAGILYAVTSRGLVKGISPEGRLLWEHPVAEDSPDDATALPTLPLAVGSGVIVGDTRGNLVRFQPDGRPLWRIRRGASVADRLAADPVHGIAVGITHNSYDQGDTLLLLDPLSGRERWSRPTNGARLVSSPVITSRQVLVGLATVDSAEHRHASVTAFNVSGTLAWKAPLELMPRGISGDNVGNSYISCSGVGRRIDGGAVVSFDSLGRRRWDRLFQSAITAPPSVSATWIYFVSRRDGRTGLFTYSHDGTFGDFVTIDQIPDVLAETTILSWGQLILAGLDSPVIVRVGG